MRDWAECVPNYSEGRDPALLRDLESALAAEVELLDRHADPDHNRSVFTVVGSLDGIERAVLASAAVAAGRIDLAAHRGVHPRVGAVDVIPVVPLATDAGPACVAAARRIGTRLWAEHGIPAFLYGDAAMRAGRTRLETVRRLGFERLRELARGGEVPPDIGGPALHPSLGACCVGVRPPMAAFNVHLETADASVARRIARAVREASGGLPGVKALGLYLESEGVAQVSMNLTRLDLTPVDAAFDAVCAEAAGIGVRVRDSELVGLVPRAALGPQPDRLRIRGFRSAMILEERLRDARARRGASVPQLQETG